MLGVLVNTAAVIAGGLIGLVFKKGLGEKLTSAVMTILGLFTLYVGIDGALEGQDMIVVLISAVLGTIIGTLLDLDGLILKAGEKLGGKSSGSGFAQGFMSGTLLFCIGAMAVVGSLRSGLTGDHSITYTKSAMDFISAMMLTASLGVGVLFSSISVFAVQGSIVLLAGVLAPVLSETAIADLSCTGSLFIIALGLNLMGVTKIKVANGLPAIVITPVILWLWNTVSGLLVK